MAVVVRLLPSVSELGEAPGFGLAQLCCCRDLGSDVWRGLILCLFTFQKQESNRTQDG